MKSIEDIWNKDISYLKDKEERHKDKKIICVKEMWLISYICDEYSVPFALYDSEELANNILLEINNTDSFSDLIEVGYFEIERTLPVNATVEVLKEIEKQNNSCC
jgi:hypothetical protein